MVLGVGPYYAITIQSSSKTNIHEQSLELYKQSGPAQTIHHHSRRRATRPTCLSSFHRAALLVQKPAMQNREKLVESGRATRTAAEFKRKWSRYTGKESSAYVPRRYVLLQTDTSFRLITLPPLEPHSAVATWFPWWRRLF